MAVSVQSRGSKHQLRVTHKLLPKPYFYTFDDEQAARNYGTQLKALLDRGIVPTELMGQEPGQEDPLFFDVAQQFAATVGHAPSEASVFKLVSEGFPGLRISGITMQWAEGWVQSMKLSEHLAPSTIRKRVGLMGRILDWHFRKITPADKSIPVNPLRMLPKNYSVANQSERRVLTEQKLEVKKDQARDRRFMPGEEERIRAVFAGFKRPDRQRKHDTADDPEFQLLFEVILRTGMRLSEAMWQRKEKIDMADDLIHVDGSKGWYGAPKPRTVPMTPDLKAILMPHVEGSGYLFSFWDGNPDTKKDASRRLSQRFRSLFDYAEVTDFHEHDLRHEATCRWVTMRNKNGHWMFSDIEICRIMGWTDPRLMLRYASLRGSDLSQRLRE